MQSENLDFRGYFHMDELVRKTARELVLLGWETDFPKPSVLQTPIGTKVGTWGALVPAQKSAYFPAVGTVRGLLSEQPFGWTARRFIDVSFAGEGYEDFRRTTGIPFFTTATVKIEGRTPDDPRADFDYKTVDPNRILALRRKVHEFSPVFLQMQKDARNEVGETVSKLAERMRLGSFSRKCEYCKSMFIGEGNCPYCGGTGPTDHGSIVADRASSRDEKSPFGR